MLGRFRVDNFKSLVDAEFQPAGLNLLVGANNAGKTNLCHALRFLSLTARMPLDDAARECTAEPWNLFNVYSGSRFLKMEVDCTLRDQGERLRFSYTLQLTGEETAGSRSVTRPLVVSFESLKVTGDELGETQLVKNSSGKTTLFNERSNSYDRTRIPNTATMLSSLYDFETNRLANVFKRYLGSWGYYSLDPVQLRSNLAIPMDRVLNATGSNLCSVLYALHNEQPREEKKLVEAAKLMEPRLDLISFQSPDPDHVYMFFEDRQGHRFGVQTLSDGTLRFLAISLLIIASRNTGGTAPGPPLIMIEEPENGIFVGLLKPLFERIDPSGEGGQFVFTSHNPYFIDLFDAVPDGVHVVKWVSGSTVVRPEAARIQERLGKFSLGELHFRGLLE